MMIPKAGDPEGAGRQEGGGSTSGRITLSALLIGQEGSRDSSVAKQPLPRRSERLRRTQPTSEAPDAAGRTYKVDDGEDAEIARRGQRGSRTATKRRRKAHVGNAAAGPTKKLTDLPLTLVATIIEFVGPAAALALSRSCKIVRDLLDPREVLGKRTWRTVREADGWPDPARIAMSDYTFLTSLFGHGCNFCSEHPHVKKAHFADLTAYEKECERLNQFGPRTQAALEAAVAREVDERRMVLAQERFCIYLSHRCRLLNIVNVPPAPVVNDFLPEDELELIADKAIASWAKSMVRKRWLSQHASSAIDSANFAAVQKLPAYVSAQPDDEPAFLEQLAQARAEIPADLRAALESEEALRGKPDSDRDAVLRDTVNAAVELASFTGEAAAAVFDRTKTLLHAIGQEAFDRSLTEGILFCLRCWKYIDGGATRSVMLLHTHTDCTDYGVFYWLLSSPPPPETELSRYPELLRQVKPRQTVVGATNPATGPSSSSSSSKGCTICGTSITPIWCKGPLGAVTLCAICGAKWLQVVDRLREAAGPPDATATAGTASSTSSARLTPPPLLQQGPATMDAVGGAI
ncbi:hypothetical protein HK405_003145 [Cladochytrium tenue]|nr:hypothetical protein HK405_003145 [Cladochytrium tenue]